MERREFLARTGLIGLGAGLAGRVLWAERGTSVRVPPLASERESAARPNILLIVADDQSWLHTGADTGGALRTPAFDRIAQEGVRFTHAFCASPSCTPSRGSMLTGRMFWELREGGDLWSTLPNTFGVYPDLLAAAGYHVGMALKGWGPGLYEPGGWTQNPAGPQYPTFDDFLATRPAGAPFCFWYGSHRPHRPYPPGTTTRDIPVPPCLPDVPEVRQDLGAYCLEIERYDREAEALVARLEELGELRNTLVIMTSDNGMPFPRAKGNLYDEGTRMPLAVRWPVRVPGGRVVDDLVSLCDLAPTFLEAAGVAVPADMTARSFLDVLTSAAGGQVGPGRDHVFLGRERHSLCRAGDVGYPARAIRTRDFLYLRNFEPDRWPAGDPEAFGDVDDSPTKSFMLANRADPDAARLFRRAFARRPHHELYDLRSDPDQMTNVAYRTEYASARASLQQRLWHRMVATGDLRAYGQGSFWDTCPYYGPGRGVGSDGGAGLRSLDR